MAGIIPAGAGLTGISKLPMWQIRDHPRGCRAHTYDANTSARVWGSSPRVRGSPAVVNSFLPRFGIIPAGAGLTDYSFPAESPFWDHPRGCGAHQYRQGLLAEKKGSSPRVRGSPAHARPVEANPGIIPAGAGLTSLTRRPTLAAGDHPRGCGAHMPFSSASFHFLGSSPRVRGSHRLSW